MTKQETLKYYFGHENFRHGQEAIVSHLLGGGDALCVMPTGAGKSICYQVPALLFSGITLVVSPLISLMKDQVAALVQAGVPAAFINSSLTMPQYRLVLERMAAGAYKIIYVAPERLETEGFLQAVSGLEISFLAVDEAHCVSQWGQDFRPSYLKVLDFAGGLPQRPVIGAFTATATRQVKEDVVRILQLREPLVVTTGFDRPNLYFGVEQPADKDQALLAMMEERRGQSGIVYCSTRKAVEEVCQLLCGRGYSAAPYHAGLPDGDRRQNQEDFVYDRRNVMVATNAFGMGIDKSNVSFVIHYNMPKNIESYYQEAGRAGRDGTAADCILLYSPRDVRTNLFLIENGEPNPELDEAAQQALLDRERLRLRHMTYYCKTGDCLRRYILNYFGEKSQEFCGNCSACKAGFQLQDITRQAQIILSCVAKTGQRYGVVLIAEVLRGSKNQRVLSLGLQGQSTYGLLAELPAHRVRQIIDTLILADILQLTEGEYPVLNLGAEAGAVLSGQRQVEMKVPVQAPAAITPAAGKSPRRSADLADPELYEKLRQLRSRLAVQARVPSYMIFSDATLADMSQKQPLTAEDFLQVSGVGQVKLQRYGKAFMELIAEGPG